MTGKSYSSLNISSLTQIYPAASVVLPPERKTHRRK